MLRRTLSGKPDLLKPNAEELAELAAAAGFATASTADELEADPEAAAAAAAAVVRSGVGAVLATLGSKGAVLVTADGAWLATHPPVAAVSTVGAGDSSLAGYLLAHARAPPRPIASVRRWHMVPPPPPCRVPLSRQSTKPPRMP